jgi:ribosomal-protein-alanine N-acetyltransferase
VHVNGSWSDHVYYAITAEEVAEGLFRRWQDSLAASRPASSLTAQT